MRVLVQHGRIVWRRSISIDIRAATTAPAYLPPFGLSATVRQRMSIANEFKNVTRTRSPLELAGSAIVDGRAKRSKCPIRTDSRQQVVKITLGNADGALANLGANQYELHPPTVVLPIDAEHLQATIAAIPLKNLTVDLREQIISL